ncbi:glycosyltransferase [Spirillospora albida]|uniref:glycosyltransferase n=1 Tax=Spirillospora albida TaxID=58123 RepID=UPI000AAEDB6C|nr:glycosyltransferase [Spirillospora albida]
MPAQPDPGRPGAPRAIVIVANNVDGMGGVQRWAHRLARMFAGRGDRVTLVGVTTVDDPHHHDRDGSYRVRTLHDPWRPPALAHRPGTLRGRMDVAARARDAWRDRVQRQGAERLSRLLDASGPGTVVIAAQVWAMEWVRRADTSGMRVIGMSHESYAATRASSRYRRVKELYAGVDRMVVLTEEDADAWARDGMTGVDHIPNPLHIAPAGEPGAGGPVVACVGRLSYEKGVDLMLEAWERVAPRRPDWRLRLYGAGPEEEALRELAAAGGSVEFRGVIDDVGAALAEASVFALPSRAEGLPMSVLEAMAYGRPTVAFDCAPGVRALIGDPAGGGLLVPPGDTVAFARELARLMDDAELRRELGAKARVSAGRFAPDAVLARWDRLFDLLHRDRPSAFGGSRAPERPVAGRAVTRTPGRPAAEPAPGG